MSFSLQSLDIPKNSSMHREVFIGCWLSLPGWEVEWRAEHGRILED